MTTERSNVPFWLWLLALSALTFATATAPLSPAWADEDEDRGREVDNDFDDEEWDEDEQAWDEQEEMEWFFVEVEAYQQLLKIVLTTHEIAEDPTVAAVAAVLSVEEHTEGPEESAKFLEGLLPEVSDATVVRAIRLQLIDFYADMDQPKQAQEQLRRLIVGEGGEQ